VKGKSRWELLPGVNSNLGFPKKEYSEIAIRPEENHMWQKYLILLGKVFRGKSRGMPEISDDIKKGLVHSRL
jgi:hypothetical protein